MIDNILNIFLKCILWCFKPILPPILAMRLAHFLSFTKPFLE